MIADRAKEITPQEYAEDVAEQLAGALRNGEDAVAIACIEKLRNEDVRSNPQDRFLLREAINYNRIKVIEYMLENGMRVNVPGLDGSQGLHQAAANDNVVLIRAFVELAQVGVDLPGRKTAIHLCILLPKPAGLTR